MILNIVPLPNYRLDGEVSTVQPLFIRREALEDTYGFGCCYDARVLADFNKYKIIEKVGEYIIERVVYTRDNLFAERQWWNAHIDVIPVWSKMYSVPPRPQAYVYRYLNGSTDMAAATNYAPALFQTVYTPVFSSMYPLGLDVVDPDVEEKAKYVVPGNDDLAIRDITTMKDMIRSVAENEFSYEDFVYNWEFCNPAPKYLPDPYHELYGKSMTSNQLKQLLGTQYLQRPVFDEQPGFDTNLFYNCNYDANAGQGTISSIMLDLEQSGYTNIEISFLFGSKGTTTSSKMWNFYLGESILYERKDFTDEKTRLINSVMRYATVTKQQQPTLLRFNLVKTWSEHVFITLSFQDKCDERHLYDLIALSIGSPLFTDING